MATIKAKELQQVCQTVADLRAVTLALAAPESADRINRAFDSASADLAKVLKPHNPGFNVVRFMRGCGAKGAE